MANRVFIIHGWEGNPSSNWFPWLKSKLEERGISAFVPQLPDPFHPKQEQWLCAMRETVEKPTKDDYLIGHSLGCITILRYLESLGADQMVGGAVLVAGFTDDLGYKELSDFYRNPINWEKINLHCKRFVSIASDNDQYVALKYGDILKEKLGAKVVVQPKMGHFNMIELHVALNELLKMIGK